jgi:hypothetical protein
MIVEIGTEAAQFLLEEYINEVSVAVFIGLLKSILTRTNHISKILIFFLKLVCGTPLVFLTLAWH